MTPQLQIMMKLQRRRQSLAVAAARCGARTAAPAVADSWSSMTLLVLTPEPMLMQPQERRLPQRRQQALMMMMQPVALASTASLLSR